MAITNALLATAIAAPPGLMPARQQMAISLGFHIVVASFGVALPAFIFVMHWRGAFRNDVIALTIAHRWSKVAAVLFAIGAVSGTVLSFEMGLLWPGLMGRFGDVIGLPFGMEGIGFFLEAIFLGLYLYGWGRMPLAVDSTQRQHVSPSSVRQRDWHVSARIGRDEAVDRAVQDPVGGTAIYQ
jgi:cytochrome bd ubiquinol oxidase subunit I